MHTTKHVLLRSLCSGLFSAVLALAGTPLHAQIFADEGVLQGTRVEVGINTCGVYGANASTLTALGGGPEGPFNGNVISGLGAVYINEPGMLPPICGDYWLPGSPEESFGIQIDGGPAYKNASLGCSFNDISGSLTGYSDLGSARRMVWNGFVSAGGTTLTIEQETTLGVNDRYFKTEIRIQNAGIVPVSDLYYARSTDPDNVQPSSGSFTTTNTVVSQADAAGNPSVVSATGSEAGGFCYMALVSADPRSRAAIGTSGSTFALTEPAAVWNGGDGYALSGSITMDWSISLAFRIDSLMPGQTDTLRFAHVFVASDINEALGTDTLDVCLPPFNLASFPSASRAGLRWDGYPNHIGYKLRGGVVGGSPFVKTTTNDSIRINGLTPSTAYQWKVRAKCSDGSESAYAPVQLFSTPALRGMAQASAFKVFPNPASGVFALSGETLPTYDRVRIIDMAGRLVQEVGLNGQSTLTLNAAGWNSGIYTVQLLGKGAPQYLRLQVR